MPFHFKPILIGTRSARPRAADKMEAQRASRKQVEQETCRKRVTSLPQWTTLFANPHGSAIAFDQRKATIFP